MSLPHAMRLLPISPAQDGSYLALHPLDRYGRPRSCTWRFVQTDSTQLPERTGLLQGIPRDKEEDKEIAMSRQLC